ncbi:MAG: glycosyltransferase [Calditrichia bacterium]
MSYLLLFMLGALIVVFGITLTNTLFAPMLKNAPAPSQQTLVSVLIPARNEAVNIDTCLRGLRKQNYSALEIIVLDDQSSDVTGSIVESNMQEDERVRLISGKPLPPGWTGKNWACHQLSQQANGEYLIFTDADTQHHPDAVLNTVGWIDSRKLALLSSFSQQLTATISERLVLPIVDIFLYCSLPLWLIYWTKSPLLAAASGQWIAFSQTSYEDIGGHIAVQNQVVEDVEFARLAKRKGKKILAVSGVGRVYCRMYRSAAEVWEGFTKNIFGIMGYNTPFFIIMMGLLFICCVLPYLLLFSATWFSIAIAAVGINLLVRLMLVLKLKHDAFTSIVLHPIGILATILIGLNSWRSVKQGHVIWKDRTINI